MQKVNSLVRRTQLVVQELGPSMAVATALMMLPGGYLIAITGWISRHWPFGSASPR